MDKNIFTLYIFTSAVTFQSDFLFNILHQLPKKSAERT